MGCVKVFNGKIYNGRNNFLNEIFIEDKKFKLNANNYSKSIDLEGKTVLPGFIDSHTHMISAGLNKLGLDLKHSSSLDEVFAKIKKYLKKANSNVVFAYGLDETKLKEKRAPTKKELDDITKKRTFYIQRIDHHSLFCNTEFEKKFNIKSKNGFVNAQKYEKIQLEILKSFTKKDFDKGLKLMEKEAFKNGVTSVHTLEGMKGFTETIDYLLENRNKYSIDFIIYPQIMDLDYVKKRKFDRIGGCILLDGSFGSRTAALRDPYEDDKNNFGKLYIDDKKLFNFALKAHKEDMQLSFHAIGDRAIKQILDIYTKILSRYPKKDHRHRIEHFELADDELIQKAANLDIHVSYQPTFEYLWGGKDQMYDKRLGDRRFLTNRYNTANKKGLNFAFGSDCDITPIKPLLGIHAATNREIKNQNLSLKDAIAGYNIKSAEIGLHESKIGSIEEGKKADFVVLDRDIFNINKSEIKNIQIDSVYKKGELVYKKKEE